MADHRTLNSYGLENDGTVHLIEYRDAGRVSAYFAEDSVGNLGIFDDSRLDDLARNPAAVSSLHRENTRMRAICDRNLDVLSGLRPTPPPPLPLAPPRNNESSSSRQLGEGGRSAFRKFQSDQRPPPPLPPIRPTPRVADGDMLPPNPQTESEESSQTLATPQTDGGRGKVPQNDDGTSAGAGAGGNVSDRLFKIVQDAYADQLSKLLDMGFSDIEKNTVALFGTRGDVDAAVEQLG